MAQAIVLVFDNDKGIIKRLRKLPPKPHEEWTLFPIVYDEEKVSKIELYLRSQRCLVKRLQFQEEIDETLFSLRNKYIHFIHEIGEKSLNSRFSIKSWLKYPFRNYSLWWPSLVAEKNTVKSTAFYDLVKAFSIIRQIRKQQASIVFLNLSNTSILNSLMEWGKINNFKFINIGSKFKISKGTLFYYIRAIRNFIILINRSLMIKLSMNKSYNLRMRKFKDIKYLLFTYFPLVDSSAIKKKEFINKFYQPLQDGLKNKKKKYAWCANIVHNNRHKIKECIELGKNINEWDEILLFWEEFLKFKDLVLVFLVFHWTAIKYFFSRHKFKNLFLLEENKIKMNAWHIFKNECDDSFCGSVLINNLLHYLVYKRILKHTCKETAILYLAEMQGWEKALCAAAIETERKKIIAIQHSTIPKFFLTFFFTKNEIESEYGNCGMPRPFKLACVGDISKKLLMESGWSSNQIFTLGGIRFNHYLELIKKDIKWPEKKNKIIVALYIRPEEAKEVISKCLEAFNEEKGISVVFKGHPWNPVVPLLESLNIKSLNPPFSISDAPLSNLLLDAKIIVVSGSSAALEGLACQCQVVIPRLVSALDLNPLTGFSDLPIYVNSPHELRRVAKDILHQKNPPYPRVLAHNFLKQYISFHSRDEEFLECIDAQFPARNENRKA